MSCIHRTCAASMVGVNGLSSEALRMAHLDTATKDWERPMMADREPSPARSAGGGQLLRAGDGSRSGGGAKMRPPADRGENKASQLRPARL